MFPAAIRSEDALLANEAAMIWERTPAPTLNAMLGLLSAPPPGSNGATHTPVPHATNLSPETCARPNHQHLCARNERLTRNYRTVDPKNLNSFFHKTLTAVATFCCSGGASAEPSTGACVGNRGAARSWPEKRRESVPWYLSSGCSFRPCSTKGVVTCQLYRRDMVAWDRAIDRPTGMTVAEADDLCRAEGYRQAEEG